MKGRLGVEEDDCECGCGYGYVCSAVQCGAVRVLWFSGARTRTGDAQHNFECETGEKRDQGGRCLGGTEYYGCTSK